MPAAPAIPYDLGRMACARALGHHPGDGDISPAGHHGRHVHVRTVRRPYHPL